MKKYILIASLFLSFGLTSCNNFLDTLPDNRLTIKDEEGVRKLLISAYPDQTYPYFNEILSDNVCYVFENRSFGTQLDDQLYEWKDVSEKSSNSPSIFWSSSWNSIYTANYALSELERVKEDKDYNALRAEALLCRAYNEFMLVNIFSHSYSTKYADVDLGLPYVKEPIKDIRAKFNRESVAQNYKDIEADILEALPNVNDKIYKQAKYHFNKKAAYAFATRFYLFRQDWDKTIEMANEVLGSDPVVYLRDWRALNSTNSDYRLRGLEYVNIKHNANLLLTSTYGSLSRFFGFSFDGLKYTHNTYISKKQTIYSQAPWGDYTKNNMGLPPVELTTPFIRVMYPKYPEQFEYTDYVSGTGFIHTTVVNFTADEVLLSRAEAYIHKEMYEEALKDMNTWLSNFTQNYPALTDAMITTWNKNTPYSTTDRLTPRSKFNADFVIKDGKQEDYLQVCLFMRRLQTLQEGLRWFDIKRYGIEFERYILKNGSDIEPTGNIIKARDPRLAVQLPVDVIAAGMTPNPR